MPLASDPGEQRSRVLIANDSPVMSAVIEAILRTEPRLSVEGKAANGDEAVRLVAQLRPDLVLMDIHMPVMDGVEAIRRIGELGRRTKILVTTDTVTGDLPLIFDALKYGAIDYVRSPCLPYKSGTPVATDALRAAGAKLLHKIRTVLSVAGRKATPARPPAREPARRGAAKSRAESAQGSSLEYAAATRFLGIGCSTGGPSTLARLIGRLPRPLPVAVLVCQHIEPEFIKGFGDWLARESGIAVEVARDGVAARSDRVYVAPGGGYNLGVTATGRLQLETARSGDVHVPNIDRLFTIMAKNLGERACGVILTGMGDDGCRGLRALKEGGGTVLVQDVDSAIIASMPRAAIRCAGLDRGYTLDYLARLIGQWACQPTGKRKS